MMTTHYRGFTIALHQQNGWTAEIIRTETGKAFSQRPAVSVEEGPEACERNARNLVDAFLALKGN